MMTILTYDLDVTHLLDCAGELSASVAEMGHNAGRITWRNSVRTAEERNPISDSNRENVRAFLGAFGAWSAEEIDGWDDTELGALLLQFAAGDIREAEWVAADDETGEIDWQEYNRQSHAGRVAGRLWRDPDTGKIWFSFAR